MYRLAMLVVVLGLTWADEAPAPPPPTPQLHKEDPGVFRPPGFPYVAPYLPYPAYGYGYYPYVYHPYGAVPPYHLPYPAAPVVAGPHAMTFRGKFDGTCNSQKDGLYFVDDRSFAFCSGETKTIQPCAEGTANPPFADFASGKYHFFYDFCSVHLQAAENKH